MRTRLKIRRDREEGKGGTKPERRNRIGVRKETDGNRKKEQMKERREENRMDLRAEDVIKVSKMEFKVVYSLLTNFDAQ